MLDAWCWCWLLLVVVVVSARHISLLFVSSQYHTSRRRSHGRATPSFLRSDVPRGPHSHCRSSSSSSSFSLPFSFRFTSANAVRWLVRYPCANVTNDEKCANICPRKWYGRNETKSRNIKINQKINLKKTCANCRSRTLPWVAFTDSSTYTRTRKVARVRSLRSWWTGNFFVTFIAYLYMIR